jgi:hypothetical protein
MGIGKIFAVKFEIQASLSKIFIGLFMQMKD